MRSTIDSQDNPWSYGEIKKHPSKYRLQADEKKIKACRYSYNMGVESFKQSKIQPGRINA